MIPPLYGIETEYGIHVEGRSAEDLIAESRGLVRAFEGASVGCWNYRQESPRRDLRGFTAERLQTDPADARFDAPGARHLSLSEEHADQALGNGGRLYNDHGHPEYATPECATLASLVAHDRAGQRIVGDCADRWGRQSGRAVRIYRNNTDYSGASYGTHESYAMRRDLPADALIAGIVPFLVTRQLFAGAGKVGVEGATVPGAPFQLSQRADFLSVDASVDTLYSRPVVNTRDEPHSREQQFRRLHVIVGDANMSQWATAMKVGTTALVVDLLERGWRPPFAVERPAEAAQRLSRDRTLGWRVRLADGRETTGTEIQRAYCEAASASPAGETADGRWVVAEWREALADLDTDVMRLVDRVDWVAKRALLDSFIGAEGLDWSAPVLQSLDLSYHLLDEEAGLFAWLEQTGQTRRIVDEALVSRAETEPPEETRARIRGAFIRRFGGAVRLVSWGGLVVDCGGVETIVDLDSLIGEQGGALGAALESATDLADALRIAGDPVWRARN